MVTGSWPAARADASNGDGVAWHPEWRKVGLLEGLSLIPLGGALLAIEFAWQPPEKARWRGGIFFDSAVRDTFSARTLAAQSRAQDIGDMMYLGGMIAPIVIDAGIVALGIHQKPEVALQLLLIDLQSLALAGLVSLSAEHAVGRARPYALDCDENGVTRNARGEPLLHRCNGRTVNKSFYSGHTAATAAAAGLTCIHHQHLPLYGGGVADLVPCVTMIGISVAAGVTRIATDLHWASDVVLGWAVGAAAGYVLPAAIHYGWSGSDDRASFRVLPIARVDAGGAEISIIGAL